MSCRYCISGVVVSSWVHTTRAGKLGRVVEIRVDDGVLVRLFSSGKVPEVGENVEAIGDLVQFFNAAGYSNIRLNDACLRHCASAM